MSVLLLAVRHNHIRNMYRRILFLFPHCFFCQSALSGSRKINRSQVSMVSEYEPPQTVTRLGEKKEIHSINKTNIKVS